MKVAFLTTSFPRFFGDYAGVFVYDLARSLAKQGVQLTVLAPHTSGTPRSEHMEGFRVERFPYFYPYRWQKVAYGAGIPTNLRNGWMPRLQLPLFLTGFLGYVLRVVKDSDIVHAHWIEPGFLGLLGKMVYKRPLVVSVHRYNPMGWLGQQLYKLVLGHADHVLFNSRFTEQRCRREIAIRQGAVIPPGVDLSRFTAKESFSTHVETSDEQFIVFGLGSLLPVKGWIHLVEAIPLIRRHVDCRVVIGGQGPERERLLHRAAALGVEEHLQLLGRVSTHDVPDWMRRADVFVLPSVTHASGDTEALGMVLVEAMACGTPCVASQVGGITDVVEEGVNGFLVPPAQPNLLAKKIVHLLTDADLRMKMGQRGRNKIENQFSLSVVGQSVKLLYEQVCV